ncbi:MAG TPA: trypsin-like peptidase domain-containing protein [Steroidobacteraceae bacterium]
MSRALIFLAGSVVGGLALAFLIVLARPELIRAPRPAVAPAAAVAQGPAAESASFSAAVERSAPAVVNIYTARVVTERVPPSSLSELFGNFLPRYRQRVERSLGSGVIIDAAGHIITNHHVIADAAAIRTQLADGRIADATVVGRDPDTDLAVLKIDLSALPVMPLGRSDRLKVGDLVLAIGDPVGLAQTVTHGIVSATGRGQLGVATFENFIQTDAPINFGNSGGALVDTHGELVGINTAVPAKNLGVEGIGFAIPVNLVRGVMGEILDHGRVIRGWIGVVTEDVTPAQATQLGLIQGGIVISNLYLASPALKAGLQPGDLILAFDGTAVTSSQEAMAQIAGRHPGTPLSVTVLRAGKHLSVRLVIVERPKAA